MYFPDSLVNFRQDLFTATAGVCLRLNRHLSSSFTMWIGLNHATSRRTGIVADGPLSESNLSRLLCSEEVT
jgi:hypothetical protein